MRKKRKKRFSKKKYKVDGRGDFWSSKSRKEKIEQGIQKYPPVGTDTSFATMVNPIFASLNERVHGNTMVASYFSFNKQKYADEYRGQVALGLLTVSVLFYVLIHAYWSFQRQRKRNKAFLIFTIHTFVIS